MFRGYNEKKRHRDQAVNFVFTGEIFSFMLKGAKYVLTACSQALVGDLVELQRTKLKPLELAEKRARENVFGNGIAIVRVGPFFYPLHHYVFILPTLGSSPETIKTRLRSVMDLDSKNARQPYKAFQTITDEHFFIAQDGPPAMMKRKNLSGHLSPRIFFDKGCQVARELKIEVSKFNRKETLIRDINIGLMQIFSDMLFQSKTIPDNAMNLITKLDDEIKSEMMGRGNKNMQRILKLQFQHFVTFLQKDSADPLMVKNKSHVNDNLDVPSAIFLAIINIANVIGSAYMSCSASESEDEHINFFKNLCKEIQDNEADIATVMDRKNMPYLHALYRESLRIANTTPLILRYTEKPITVKGLSIPARSTIACSTQNQGIFARTDRFAPEYFISSDAIERSRSDSLTPFGLGIRRCPGEAISEALFKSFLFTLIKRGMMLEGVNKMLVDDESLLSAAGTSSAIQDVPTDMKINSNQFFCKFLLNNVSASSVDSNLKNEYLKSDSEMLKFIM